nr:PEP-CTERM sorting domain-containing protein [uncultured Desulfobacter sp.]
MKNLRKTLLVMSFLMILLLVAGNVNAAPVTLSNAPDYDWYKGCAPTSAAMMMGYSNLALFGVTVLELTGGTEVPVPASILLLGAGLIGIVRSQRRHSFS